MSDLPYEEVKSVINNNLFIGIPASKDLGDRVALIGMVCHLTNAFKQKKPDIDHYKVIRMCTKETVLADKQIKALALACDWFSEGCVKFPDFGIKTKEMPARIASLMHDFLPF